MRYYFDTEFIDRPWGLTLISIGIVAEDGRELYAINECAYEWEASEWVKENVFTRLQPVRHPIAAKKSIAAIRDDIIAFVGDDKDAHFWAYYGAFDWVALCWIMGGMLSLPKGWYWICHELRTALDDRGFKDFRDDGRADEHNALADARWVAKAHAKLLAAAGDARADGEGGDE